jgi:hypothetical protein
MNWWLVNNKPDDNGCCFQVLVQCEEETIENVYNYKKVDEEDVEVLLKYIDELQAYDEDATLEELIEQYLWW